jgi:CRISPR/Cas system-associated exonuclease Cas4 (RecB family)
MLDFDKLIDQHIAREFKPKQIGRYYPSEVGTCLRKVWYSYKYPQDIEPDLRKIFEVGDMLHGFVVEVLKSEKNKDVELVKSEMPFSIDSKDFVISGRVDDLILIKSSGKNVLVEVKSTKDVSFIKEPQSNHMMQLMFYMHATKIHDGVILYIDKNNLKSKVFEVKFDEEEAGKIMKRFAFLHEHLVNNKLPFVEAKVVKDMNWMCKFCEYRTKCNKDEL